MTTHNAWRGSGRRYPAERLYYGRPMGWWIREAVTIVALAGFVLLMARAASAAALITEARP